MQTTNTARLCHIRDRRPDIPSNRPRWDALTEPTILSPTQIKIVAQAMRLQPYLMELPPAAGRRMESRLTTSILEPLPRRTPSMTMKKLQTIAKG